MAFVMNLLKPLLSSCSTPARTMMLSNNPHRGLQTSAAACKTTAGKYKVTRKRNKPLTYEMAHKPNEIVARKGWNSFNTSNLAGGLRRAETAVEDMFIRRFVTGTWHGLVLSEVIVKRQANHIRVAAIIRQALTPTKMYFLIGYTEELLANWIRCPVTLELQTVPEKTDVVYKYI